MATLPAAHCHWQHIFLHACNFGKALGTVRISYRPLAQDYIVFFDINTLALSLTFAIFICLTVYHILVLSNCGYFNLVVEFVNSFHHILPVFF